MSEAQTAAAVLGRLGADVPAVAARLHGVDLDRVVVRSGRIWLLGGYSGIALPWGIYLRPGLEPGKCLPTLLHELVHMEQWRRDGLVRFSVVYIRDYASGRAKRLGHRKSYLAIGAEKEARRKTVVLLAAANGADSAG